MKQYALHYIYAALFLVVATAATPSACMARGIRIIPRSIQVLRDSLHLHLLMDLNQVSVGSSLAITFTPVLSHKKQQLDLSAVVISGTRRERNGFLYPPAQQPPDRFPDGRLPHIRPFRILDAACLTPAPAGKQGLLRTLPARHRHTEKRPRIGNPVRWRICGTNRSCRTDNREGDNQAGTTGHPPEDNYRYNCCERYAYDTCQGCCSGTGFR